MKIDLLNANTVYMLGYFWADCHYKEQQSPKREFYFEIKTKDFIEIWPLIQTLGFNHFSTRKRKNSKNTQSCVRLAKFKELEFFSKYSFNKKYSGCPIYFDLSPNMQIVFIKGFLDGDGSISLDKNGNFRVSFNGKYNQNWDFLEDFLTKNNFAYNIYNKSRIAHHSSHKKFQHQYSVIEILTNNSKVEFCKLLSLHQIGLSRKINVLFSFLEFRKIKNETRLKKYGKSELKTFI